MKQPVVSDHLFCVADFVVRITFAPSQVNGMFLIPSFEPFRTSDESVRVAQCEQTSAPVQSSTAPLLFHLTVDDSLPPIRAHGRERIGCFDTGNGETAVDRLPDGGYQYIIRDIDHGDCCLLQADKSFANCRCALHGDYTMRSFGLMNALMLIFAFAAGSHSTLMVHASALRYGGRGYAFIARSGTGKSTHVNQWMRAVAGTEILNDDTPIVRIIGDDVFIYGSPWSGKTTCYRQVKAPLGAITRIERAQVNSIERLRPIQAFACLFPSCSTMKWDKDIFDALCRNITTIVERIPIYTLYCLPDEAAAELCHATVSM